MKIGLIQQANTCDRTDNIKKLKNSIRLCADEGAELVVLQELHNGLYFCQTEDTQMFDQAETIPGPSTEEFGASRTVNRFLFRVGSCQQHCIGNLVI